MISRLHREVYERDLWTCRYCGDTATEVAPIIPRILGGSLDLPENLVSVCRRDRRRFDKALQEAVVRVAASHPDELAEIYGEAIEALPYLSPAVPEIPGQATIEEALP